MPNLLKTEPSQPPTDDFCCCCNGQINGGIHGKYCATPVVEQLRRRVKRAKTLLERVANERNTQAHVIALLCEIGDFLEEDEKALTPKISRNVR